MLNLSYSSKTTNLYGCSPINWEETIVEIALEPCDAKADPLGYHVIFYGKDMKVAYTIGASLLRNRLRKLNKAGFAAPMTEKAINMIEANNRFTVTH